MEPAVTFHDVYKEYPFYQHITAGFKSFLFHLPRSIASLKKTRFVALKGISFEVGRGEVFGIIGKNGSGKSTILALTAGVMKPDRGTVATRGKISSLLELGAGFHPELSGVENIMLNGILSGNTREEMLKKMEEIIAFSELGDFVYQPLRTYSSGMYARLGFSVAVHVNPEILLVDEALAVGDAEFKEKCNRKMKEFMESGATIIIVSHDMPAITELCNRVAWIDSGTILKIGDPEDVIEAYLNFLGVPPDRGQNESLGKSVAPDTDHHDSCVITALAMESRQDLPLSEVSGQELADHNTRKPQPGAHSWWDSPVIMHQCEIYITGDPEISFYEYLKKEYSIAGLDKGLSICNKLKVIEQNFIDHDACRSFDTFDPMGVLDNVSQGIPLLRTDYYDLVLCIDVLSHMSNLGGFLEQVRGSLKHKKFIVAIEYVGPARFHYTEKERSIAGMFLGAFNGRYHLSSSAFEVAARSSANSEPHPELAISSDIVIPILRNCFDIIAVRFFGGPFFDLVLSKLLGQFDLTNNKDSMLLRTIIHCEQVLIRHGILGNHYALIIGVKR